MTRMMMIMTTLTLFLTSNVKPGKLGFNVLRRCSVVGCTAESSSQGAFADPDGYDLHRSSSIYL